MLMNCETAQEHLFEYADGALQPGLSTLVEAHLTTCDQCGEMHNNILRLSLAAATWTDEDIPRWRPADAFAAPVRPATATFLQWAGIAASLVILVFATLQVRISANDGYGLEYRSANYVKPEQLRAVHQQLVQSGETTALEFRNNLARVTVGQIESNQVLARALIDASRSERHAEMAALAQIIEEDQVAQQARNAEHILYLMQQQAQDQQSIARLQAALAYYVREGENL